MSVHFNVSILDLVISVSADTSTQDSPHRTVVQLSTMFIQLGTLTLGA